MSDGFDPYYKWLAIPPGERPPNHYLLLGLQLFENDADVISIAADRQMLHVKSFASGPQSQFTQQLLNELAKAKICLLNTKQKSIYDAELAVRTGSVSTVAGLPSSSDILDPDDFSVGATVKLSHAETHLHRTPPAVPPPVLKTRKQESAHLHRAGPLAEQPATTMRVEGSDAIKKKAALRRLQKIRLKRVNLLGHVVAPFLGLAIGYYVLCLIGPGFDFLGLMHSEEEETTTAAVPNAPSAAGHPEPPTEAPSRLTPAELAAQREQHRRQQEAEAERQRELHEQQLQAEKERQQRAEEARLAAEEARRVEAQERARREAAELEEMTASLGTAAVGGNPGEFIASMKQLQARKQEPSPVELAPMLMKLLPACEEPEQAQQVIDWSLDAAESLQGSQETPEATLAIELASAALLAARKAKLSEQNRRATLLLVPK